MYRLNPLMRSVLITADEVIFHAPTKHTLDPRTIEQHIIVAEERIIRPLLGYDFYQAMIAEKNKVVTAGNKAALQTQINDSLPDEAQDVVLAEDQIINALEYLTSDNSALWKQHLWKLTAECVMLLAYPEGYIQFGTNGPAHQAPQAGPMTGDAATAPDLRTMKWIMDKKMMDRIDPLSESMHLWICKQQKADVSKYSLYCRPCDCDSKGVAYKRKSDIILGIYDDEENSRCCD